MIITMTITNLMFDNYWLDHHVSHIKQNHPMSAKLEKRLHANIYICRNPTKHLGGKKNTHTQRQSAADRSRHKR